MDIKIRKAERKDCALILDFIKGIAIYEKMGFAVIRDLSGGHFLHNEWDREGEKPYRRLYILQKEL